MITTTPKIGLRISGTKQRRGGFQPLVAVGVLAGNEANNMDRVTLVAEKPAFVVKHTSEYVLYMLIDRRVKSFDADAPGVLTIALTIASDAQLADQKSPYTLLKEIYDTFVSTYMTRLSDGRDSFIDCDADPEVFREIINRYPLESRPRPFMPMNPQGSTGIVCVPFNKLEAFFRDTGYEEFRNFCDIEIGTQCTSSPGLEKLEIPKIPRYEIWINGMRQNEVMRPVEGEDSLFCQLPGYPVVSFTLDALLSAPGQKIESADAIILLNPVKNRIECTINKLVQNIRVVFRWVTEDEASRTDVVSMIKKSKVKITLGIKDVSSFAVSDNIYEVNSDKVEMLLVNIAPRFTPKYDLDARKELITHKGEQLLQITITVKKKPIDVRDGGRNPYGVEDPARSQRTTRDYGNTSNHTTLPAGPISKKDKGQKDWEEKPQKKGNKFLNKFLSIFKNKSAILGITGILCGMLLGVGIMKFLNKSEGGGENSRASIDSLKENIEARNDSIIKAKNDSINKAKKDSIIKAKNDSINKVKNDSIKKAKGQKGTGDIATSTPQMSRKDAINLFLEGKMTEDQAKKVLTKEEVNQLYYIKNANGNSELQKDKVKEIKENLKNGIGNISDAYNKIKEKIQ